MTIWALLSVLTDIMLGGLAYRLAIKLAKTQANHEARLVVLERKT